MTENLSIREQRFIPEYLKCGVAQQACVAAGWSPAYARKYSYKILQRPAVAAAIKAAQEELRANAKYDLEASLSECDQLMTEARNAKQYSAVANLYATKQKLTGLIQDKLKLEVEAKPSLNAAIEAGRQRVALGWPTAAQIIDSTATDVTPAAPGEVFGE